jgi:hypothetical protein
VHVHERDESLMLAYILGFLVLVSIAILIAHALDAFRARY